MVGGYEYVVVVGCMMVVLGYRYVVVGYLIVGRRYVGLVVSYMSVGYWCNVVAHLHVDVDVGLLNNDRRTHMACTPLYIDSETRLSA
jgi:hypothetical protein